MKRDMDLIREILLKIEAQENRNGLNHIQVPGYSNEQVNYHVRLLHKAGFLEGPAKDFAEDFQYVIRSLTWQGHEFLENIRDNSVWEKTKSAAQNVGSFSIEVLSGLAKGFVKQKVKEYTGFDIG